ncbi:MAG TPA: bifunctional [glutamine synthetase] adenylyltransferase/[glutamine synthetase]-adenylyl-L-tyrosine phosphorylase [Acidimicrobiia bacterium]|nr:bifunctional [glutamine synthetase] adenylyltransferase/[glutamine synthetase]-adenylyl-L-tyrosine phosphorylase [Acidimicrobiia bacterium]
MPHRMRSPARLGVGAEQQPRLEGLGWIVDGEVTPAAEDILRLVISGPDPTGTLNRLLALAEKAHFDPAAADTPSLVALAATSRGLWEALLRHPEWLEGGAGQPSDPRVLVQSSLIAIAREDLTNGASLEATTRRLTEVADRAAALALGAATAEVAGRHTDGPLPRLAVIALGKWGGRELNYASDIDLVFVYEPREEPERDRRLALRIATEFIEALATPTSEGIAFRVDAGLRPEGSTGPLVRTLEGYRSYYEKWGEAWEAQALLKARAAAGDRALGESFISTVSGFVWPDELAPDAVRELRQLKQRAEEEANPDDIKRAPGGIRDVEFTIQLLQLIHGRADHRLRVPGTLEALTVLVEGDYVRAEDAEALADSYRFLRTVEHRLQLWQMSQTHRIPIDREPLSLSLGFRPAERTAAEQFNENLAFHRRRVRELHEALYYRPLLEAFSSATALGLDRSKAQERLEALGFADVSGAAKAFEILTAGLSRRSAMMQQLLPLMLDWLADSPDPDLGLTQLVKLVEASSDQAELTGTVRDRPVAAQRLCHLLGSSRLIGRFLDRLPEFLPRLADDRLLTDLPRGEDVTVVALERMKLRQGREARIASLRRFVRRRVLRVAAADLLELADVETVASSLSDTADAAVTAALWTGQASLDRPADLAVVAMGKWGGHELGYGSDLDLMYVGPSGEEALDSLRVATEFAAVISQPTSDGVAYQIDPDLRPEGRKGALVRSLEAFRLYYELRAEPWERIALIKARPVAGPEALTEEFSTIREEYAFPLAVGAEAVRAVRHVKARIEKERLPRNPEFHLKLGPGGLSDIEFLVQLWQFRIGRGRPHLQTTSTLEALSALNAEGVLSISDAEHLQATYRLCSRIRNRLYLQTATPHDALPIDGSVLARLARSLGYRHRGEMREEYRAMTRKSRRLFEKYFFED